MYLKYCLDITNKTYSSSSSAWHDFPLEPSSFKPSLMMLTTNSNRTVGKDATLHKEYLGMKWKFEMTFNYATLAKYQELVSLFYGHNFINVYCPDFGATGTTGSVMTMYGGDMAGNAIRIRTVNGVQHIKDFKDLSWNLIQR